MAALQSVRGRIFGQREEFLVFSPLGTNYQLNLLPLPGTGGTIFPSDAAASESGSGAAAVNVILRSAARKVYAVSTGGLFVAPIIGPPRIVQGRVKAISDGGLIVDGGVLFNVRLPDSPDAVDLNIGEIAVGTLVNVVLLPGSTIEPVPPAGELQTAATGNNATAVSAIGSTGVGTGTAVGS